MPVEGVTPILNVSDIEASIEWFAPFGWKVDFRYGEPTDFAGIASKHALIFLCRGAQGSLGRPPSKLGDEDNGGVWMTWWVSSRDEVDAFHELALERDCDVSWPPTDEEWGVREFHLHHPDGHTFRVSCGQKD